MNRMPFAGNIPEVLVVDDNLADKQLLGEAFAELGIPVHLHHANTGEVALERLEHRGAFGTAPDPEMMILDLNMPRFDGRALLQRLADDPHWRHLPVVVLSSSIRASDIDFCARMGALSYFVKPSSWDEYLRMVKSFKEFWVAKP